MGLFDRLFGITTETEPQPDIRFGRYSDSYKEAASYAAWDQSLRYFEEEHYLESYRAFFTYLRDEEEDNVRFWDEGDGIIFEIYQGSKKICGFANAEALKAEAKVARAEKFNVAFMRRMIELNFELEYSRFALDPDGNITIVFDTYTIDGSPYKLYYALKEVATRADKQDDLLLDEFKTLKPVEVSHLIELSPAVKEAKFAYLREQVGNTLREVEQGKLNKDQYAGGVAYLLLYIIYKLDYLIKPEGYTMEVLERLHRLYSSKDDSKSTAELNQQICRELRTLLDRPKEAYFREMYRVPATFGITVPVNHDRVVALIDAELPHMDWYLDNGYETVAQAIPGFIISYCMFIYAVPKPDRAFFHLYFRIVESGFFRSLGFTQSFYDPVANTFDKKAIKQAIKKIVDDNKAQYAKLQFPTGVLNYESLPHFSRSYLQAIRNLDLTKVD